MKTLCLSILIFASLPLYGQDQYCNVNTRPDYEELATHRQEPMYKPCSTMTKKAWFDAQMLRLERRLGKTMALNPNETRKLFLEFEELIPVFNTYHYKTENQFYLTVQTLETVDKQIDVIEKYSAYNHK